MTGINDSVLWRREWLRQFLAVKTALNSLRRQTDQRREGKATAKAVKEMDHWFGLVDEAFEVLNRCEGAALRKTEGEVTYSDPDSKKTDLLVDFSGVRIGVSVTRAVGWPREDPWTVEQAEDLLADKLADIPLSTAAVSAEDAWSRQILSVIAWSPDHAAAIETAWLTLDAALTLDTIVYVTATDGDDAFVYE